MKNKYGWDIELRKTIYRRFCNVMRQMEIPFYLSHGTLLGAYRQDDWIEYDNDVDIDVKIEEFQPKQAEVLKKLNRRGLRVTSDGNGFGIRDGDEVLSLRPLWLHNKEVRVFRNTSYPRHFWDKEPPAVLAFSEVVASVPHPVEDYLNFVYTDWKTPQEADGFSESFSDAQKNAQQINKDRTNGNTNDTLQRR